MKLLVLISISILVLNTGCGQSLYATLSEGGTLNASRGSGAASGAFAGASSRATVVAAYNKAFQGPSVDMGWAGDVQNCVAGVTSVAYQQSVIDRVNYYRNLVGLGSVSLIPQTTTSSWQNAALMMSANGNLSHSPPSTWKCYTTDGAGGAGSSNLALGRDGTGAVDMYMDDFGSNNSAVGHRRWILYPYQSAMNTGDVPGANSLGVFSSQNAMRPANLDYVAWPPPGFVPAPNIPGSNRWSFARPQSGFSNAVVTMKNLTTGASMPTTLEPFTSNYGESTLVWLPQGLNYSATQDTSFLVSVSNVDVGSGVPATFNYIVTVINP